MAIVAVGKALREKLGEDGANSLVELLSSIEEKTEDRVILRAEDRFEKRLIGEISGVRSDLAILEGKIEARISEVRADFKEETASIRADFKEEIASVRADFKVMEEKIERRLSDFKTDIISFKAEIIKWMFLFWVGQLVCIAGLIKWLR